MGVGYPTVDHALHLQSKADSELAPASGDAESKIVQLRSEDALIKELWWLIPLTFLKPLVTSLTLAGGGSGGVFAPSLFIGATGGASFGLVCNFVAPSISASPGVYAIVGMGAVVAGTTHGIMSAIVIVYEMTDNYQIILPIMAAAGLASTVARLVDPESIYYKKLSRRGETIARGHDMHCLEHVMVRDVMIRKFPTIKYSADGAEIVKVAKRNAHLETLPVMDSDGYLAGIIRPEDLRRVLDTDVPSHLITAEDIAIAPPLAVSPDANLLEALRDFGNTDLETLPVEAGDRTRRQLVGLLLRADVMKRYRTELLKGGH
jgi:CIC family chloride channel protein